MYEAFYINTQTGELKRVGIPTTLELCWTQITREEYYKYRLVAQFYSAKGLWK